MNKLHVLLLLSTVLVCQAQWIPSEQEFRRFMASGGHPTDTADTFVSLRRKAISVVGRWARDYLSVGDRANGLRSKEYPYFAWIPPLVAALKPDGPSQTWSAPCFQKNTGKATSNSDGSITVTLELSEPTGLLCSDLYLMATMSGLDIKSFFSHGTHTLTWKLPSDATSAEKWDVQTNGIRVFKFLDNTIQTVGDLLSTVLLFESELTKGVSGWVADVNRDFLKKYAGVDMKKRSVTTVPVDESLIHSGDFLGVIRLDGLDPMLAWAMGSTTGHTTVALRVNGTLHIAESTVKDSYWPTDGIQITPYQQWLKQAQAAGYNVVWAPLTDKMRSKFDAEAAYKRFKELEGFQYGYNNLLYGWIDTLKDNYPCVPPDYTQCLEWEHVEIIMGIGSRLVPSVADLLFNHAFNHRLNTTGLRAADLFYTATKKGVSVPSIPTIVEQDSWLYNTTRNGKPAMGPAMVCCVFVCNMWKAGGVFADIDNEFQCAEMTNWDDYALNVLNATFVRPSQCESADPSNPLCQLLGDYTLVLNNYSSKAPYKHMADKCPSEAPKYSKPANC